MPRSNRRFDLSPFLIHFTRLIDFDDDKSEPPDELLRDSRLTEVADESKLSPFFLLREIVRRRQLRSTWSARGSKRGVYGPDPAVCFTEMPVGAFVKAALERQARGEKTSAYAIMLPKKHAFAAGARPVIYGVSTRARTIAGRSGERALRPSVLSAAELYRFVSFDGARGVPDWTHEREWRWPNRAWKPTPLFHWQRQGGQPDDEEDSAAERLEEDRRRAAVPSDGLSLDRGFSGLGLIVSSRRHADALTRDILLLIDQGIVSPKLFRFILLTPRLQSLRRLHDPAVLERELQDGAIDLAPYLRPPAKAIRDAREALVHLNEQAAAVRQKDAKGPRMNNATVQPLLSRGRST